MSVKKPIIITTPLASHSVVPWFIIRHVVHGVLVVAVVALSVGQFNGLVLVGGSKGDGLAAVLWDHVVVAATVVALLQFVRALDFDVLHVLFRCLFNINGRALELLATASMTHKNGITTACRGLFCWVLGCRFGVPTPALSVQEGKDSSVLPR